jgi:hypothetical protein
MASPSAEVNITDSSSLNPSGFKGVACVQGITTKGPLAKPIYIKNWREFKQFFGDYHPSSLFPLYCQRALDGGAKLYVSRVAHYDDVNDNTSFTGTVASVSLGGSINARSLYPGTGYNGVTVTISDGGTSLFCKITVKASGMDDQVLENVKRTNTQTELEAINQQFKDKYRDKTLINFKATFATPSTTVSFTNSANNALTGGAQDVSEIEATDYAGSSSGKTGWYSFDEVIDSDVIYNFDAPLPEVDIALAEYCKNRKDMRFAIRTPVGLNANGWEDYRMGSGAYTHDPIDTFLGKIVAGDIIVLYQGSETNISGIADVCALEMKKNFKWFSTAGPNRGKLPSNVRGTTYNVLSAALKGDYDNVYPKGINAIGKHVSFGMVFWGSRSLLLDQTKLLKFDNVADLSLYIKKELYKIVSKYTFEPNDLTMIGQIYNEVKPFMESLEIQRAIHPGKWEWIGDQNISDIADVDYNTVEDIQQGKYKAKLRFAPIVANEFIEIEASNAELSSFDVSIL